MPDHTAILKRIDAFCDRHGYSRRDFGQMVAGNTALVTRLRRGRHVYVDTYRKIEAFLDKHEMME